LQTLAAPQASAQTPPAAKPVGVKPAAAKPSKPKPLAESLPPDAKADYATGKVLFTDGDFAGALIKFEAAFAKFNDPRLLWNMAACEKNLRHYAKVLHLLARYRKEGGALLTSEDVQDANDLATALEPFTTQVTLSANEPDAEVFIDDEKVGTTPLPEPLVLDVGVRHFRAIKAGFRTYDAQIPIGGAKTTSVEVKLEHEGGHLKVNAAQAATVTIDGKVAGTGPQDLVLAVGGHELRITAPKMRAFQTEVTIQDNQTRTLDVTLEAEGRGARGPELWVAVGCDDPRPRAPDEGLSVYLDGSATATSPLAVQKSWKEDVKHDVVDYVSYPVTPGTHTARVRFPGCEAMETRVDVVEGRPSGVYGVLRPDASFFSRGPAGYPDWGRVSAGLWVTSTQYNNFYGLLSRDHNGNGNGNSNGVTTFGSKKASVTSAGPAFSVGVVGRWLTLAFDLRYATGSTTGSINGIVTPNGSPNARPAVGVIDGTSTVHTYYAGLRLGPKIPLYYAALSAGPGVAFLIQDVDSPTYGHNAEPALFLSAWAALDVQPICDFNLQLMVQGSAVAQNGHPTGNTTWVVAAGYQPNQRCRRDQAGLFRIQGSSR
jgi:hypothetical protein